MEAQHCPPDKHCDRIGSDRCSFRWEGQGGLLGGGDRAERSAASKLLSSERAWTRAAQQGSGPWKAPSLSEQGEHGDILLPRRQPHGESRGDLGGCPG